MNKAELVTSMAEKSGLTKKRRGNGSECFYEIC